jgi:hypothetical protein
MFASVPVAKKEQKREKQLGRFRPDSYVLKTGFSGILWPGDRRR